jgi:hypothetical protein
LSCAVYLWRTTKNVCRALGDLGARQRLFVVRRGTLAHGKHQHRGRPTRLRPTHTPAHKTKAQPVVWTSLGPLPRWVPGPTTWWAPGTTRLALHDTRKRGAQGLHRSSTRLGSCTCSALYRGLLDVLD